MRLLLNLLTTIFLTQSFVQGQTHLVKDINPTSSYTTGNQLSSGIEYNGELYFLVKNSSGGQNLSELWKSDGTQLGTFKATQILSGEGIHSIVNFNNKIYFSGTSQNGIELWMTDGTTAGTSLVKDLSPGTGSGDPCNFHVVNNTLFFTANYNGLEFELWKTDGSTEGTSLVETIPSTYYVNAPEWFNAADGQLFFFNYTSFDGSTIWRSDGTSEGTFEIKDEQGLTVLITEIPTSINDKLYFYGLSITGENEGIWEVNTTTNVATVVFETLNSNYKTYENEIYFAYKNPSEIVEIWKLDVTNNLTNIVHSLPTEYNAINLIGIYNDTLIYSANDLTGQVSNTIFSFCLTNQTSNEIPNLMISSLLGSSESGLIVSAYSTLLWHGLEPTFIGSAGFTEIADIFPGTVGSDPTKLLQIGNWVYFIANDGSTEKQLWKVNTITLNYIKLSDIGLTASGSDIELVTELNNILFFSANDGQNGSEPWASDGTEAGTQLLIDINTGSQGSFVRDFCVLNNEMYFFTSTPAQLYKTDGTPAGTSLIKNIEYIGNKSYTVYNNELYFVRGGDFTNQLWKTDGTSSGTVQVIQICPDTLNGFIIRPFTVGNSMFFQADDGVTGLKWYKSDGTQSGTVVANPTDNDPIFSQTTTNIHVFGDELIATKWYNNSVYIYSLNETNDAASLIHQFTDYPEVFMYQQASYFELNGEYAYFVLGKPDVGKELWRINLTNNTPELVYANINGIEELIVKDDTLFFPSGNKILAITNGVNEPFLIAENILIVTNYLVLEQRPLIIFDGEIALKGFFSYDKQTPAIISDQNVYPILSSNMGQCSISNMIGVNQNLFFTKGSTTVGSELWVYEKQLDTIPKLILDTSACQNFYWDQTNTNYIYTDYYFETLQDITGMDSLKLILSLKIYNPIPQEITGAPFIVPTEPNLCNGLLYFDVGTADLVATIDNSITSPQSNEVIVGGNLCHGIHSISISDSCGYSYQSVFIIPYPDETINNISGFNVIDSLGFIVENCTITYENIDTAFISSISVIDSTATVNWTIVDVFGNEYLEIATYNLPEGNGNYLFQISLFCPTKFEESVFAITQDIYDLVQLEENSNSYLSIYPNPSNQSVTIVFEGESTIIKLINSQGRIVFEGSIISGDQIDLTSLNSGIYFIELTTNENVFVNRFVKN